MRVQVTLEEVRRLVLGDLLRAGEAFYRSAKKAPGPQRKPTKKAVLGAMAAQHPNAKIDVTITKHGCEKKFEGLASEWALPESQD